MDKDKKQKSKRLAYHIGWGERHLEF